MRYGKKNYDYQEGTLVFIAPGQVITVDSSGEVYQPKGHALVFHPDLIHGTRFEHLLNEYFQTDKPHTIGLPSVAYCAGELNLSANYFGDLVKKETGKAAQEYIQSKVIDVAKTRIFDQSKSVSQIAYELGFKYPQHFTRFFKQQTGASPKDYRSLN